MTPHHISHQCRGCGLEFSSRSAVFRHLRDTDGACLSETDYKDFAMSVKAKEPLAKSLILFGYVPSLANDEGGLCVSGGEDAAILLLEVLGCADQKINRSYGHRVNEALRQDAGTGAISEVMSVKLHPLPKQVETALSDWKKGVNQVLEQRLSQSSARVRVLGRLDLRSSDRFNSETFVTHRRIEYLLPADIFFSEGAFPSRQDFLDRQPIFSADIVTNWVDRSNPTHMETLAFLSRLKKTMQSLTSDIVSIEDNPHLQLEKQFHQKSRSKQKRKAKNRDERLNGGKEGGSVSESVAPPSSTKKGNNVLRRRRFHNFTTTMMAHDYFAHRRLDRFYHRETQLFTDGRPYMVLSLTGDVFLQGQVSRLIGLVVAIMRGLVPPDMVDCVMDEHYPHLVPMPPAPPFAMYAVEASYSSWEGKAKMILSPRKCDRFPGGWNDEETLFDLKAWHHEVQQNVANCWYKEGVDPDGRLLLEQRWTKDVLEPWVDGALRNLREYRLWRQERLSSQIEGRTESPTDAAPTPLLSSIDKTVPVIFQTVLYHLRQANSSGLWPETSLKRQLVMVDSSGSKNGQQVSLAMSYSKANFDTPDRDSAYTSEGSASGSFSIGHMPDSNSQPKANELFPELVKAAFQLERDLCPDREPSSTIAVNRNAQFRPHIDSGAGAGQSTSLIVGLGDYTGGQLVVEGKRIDIRYRHQEFNGWKERHWTMPFEGERFSLVWFTPKGCEGKHGIDL
jgi:tRNA U38,U39,U40 pseudouridine synthase TruA